jgi:hypothetical protein
MDMDMGMCISTWTWTRACKSHGSRCVALGAGRLHMCTRGVRGDERADRARAAALYPLSAAALLLNALCLMLLDGATRHANHDPSPDPDH